MMPAHFDGLKNEVKDSGIISKHFHTIFSTISIKMDFSNYSHHCYQIPTMESVVYSKWLLHKATCLS